MQHYYLFAKLYVKLILLHNLYPDLEISRQHVKLSKITQVLYYSINSTVMATQSCKEHQNFELFTIHYLKSKQYTASRGPSLEMSALII